MESKKSSLSNDEIGDGDGVEKREEQSLRASHPATKGKPRPKLALLGRFFAATSENSLARRSPSTSSLMVHRPIDSGATKGTRRRGKRVSARLRDFCGGTGARRVGLRLATSREEKSSAQPQ